MIQNFDELREVPGVAPEAFLEADPKHTRIAPA